MSKVSISGNASGTGVFTIQAPNSNVDRVLSLPDEAGTVLTTATPGVPVNGPAFSASSSATQTFTSATFTKIPLQTEQFDTANCFDNTTNYRFTPTVAGYYQLNGYLSFSSAQTFGQITIYKNGSSIGYPTQTANTSGCWVNTLLYMNGSTDYVEVYGYSATTQGCSGAFNGCMVRSA